MGSTLRRALALTTSMMLLAGLAVISSAAPASAQLTCFGEIVTIPGTPGDDQLDGTPGPDVIHGLGGNDGLDGLGGDDIICGGGGTDVIVGGDGDDTILGGSREDTIFGEEGDDDICGDAGPDVIFGGDGSDAIGGGPGRDEIFGGADDDFLWGHRNGLCTTQGRDVRDIIDGGAGGDTIRGGPGGDILNGNAGPDFIRGNNGSNSIDGGPADDDCAQGPRIRRCERADLRVRVIGPASPAPEGEITFKVRVKNFGPHATTYSVKLGTDGGNSQGGAPQPGSIDAAALRPGRVRTHLVTSDNAVQGPDPWVSLDARVFPDARDPKPRNNKADSGRIDLQ